MFQELVHQADELSGNTALHLAAGSIVNNEHRVAEAKQQADKVKLLLNAGANPSAFNLKRETPGK